MHITRYHLFKNDFPFASLSNRWWILWLPTERHRITCTVRRSMTGDQNQFNSKKRCLEYSIPFRQNLAVVHMSCECNWALERTHPEASSSDSRKLIKNSEVHAQIPGTSASSALSCNGNSSRSTSSLGHGFGHSNGASGQRQKSKAATMRTLKPWMLEVAHSEENR